MAPEDRIFAAAESLVVAPENVSHLRSGAGGWENKIQQQIAGGIGGEGGEKSVGCVGGESFHCPPSRRAGSPPRPATC